ncbi:hypothetical protein PROFUN_04601 [Planoprotostelium fungivorum]|uniref:Uncharacterized protein n=1 Tax=Planoprotostelium fungivorum TaxID=1890364 RepID=A0A2P6NUD1_9EUKA|nr:hypothetical protein PROFUN_04601 [Planoprotostelium fungivorum]
MTSGICSCAQFCSNSLSSIEPVLPYLLEVWIHCHNEWYP